MSENPIYISKVVTDEDGQQSMLLTKELIDALKLQDGELMLWDVGENLITIQRPKYIDPK